MLFRSLFNKLDLKGRIFDTKIEINYQNKNFNKNSEKNVEIWLPEIGLNSKLSINPGKKNNETIYGRVSVFFNFLKIYMLNLSCKYLLNLLDSSIIEQYRFNYPIKILGIKNFIIFFIVLFVYQK